MNYLQILDWYLWQSKLGKNSRETRDIGKFQIQTTNFLVKRTLKLILLYMPHLPQVCMLDFDSIIFGSCERKTEFLSHFPLISWPSVTHPGVGIQWQQICRKFIMSLCWVCFTVNKQYKGLVNWSELCNILHCTNLE